MDILDFSYNKQGKLRLNISELYLCDLVAYINKVFITQCQYK